jgi:hypothetical protein
MVSRFKSSRGRNRHNGGRKTRSFKTRTAVSSNNASNELGVLGAMLGASALHDAHDNNTANGIDSIIGGGEKITETVNNSVVSSRKSIDASYLILQFLEMLNTIKIFHWSTLSYPSHKATDELHSNMSKLVDSFIEKYIAITGTPLFGLRDKQSIPFYQCKSIEHYRTKLHDYKKFMVSLNKDILHKDASELLTIRDEMIGEIDQAFYLLRLE